MVPGASSLTTFSSESRPVATGAGQDAHMSFKKKLIVTSGATLGVILVAGFAAWWFLLRSDAPPPVDLGEAVAAATSTTVPGAPAESSSPDGVEGPWSISPGSFAGYRVQEELVRVGFTTAAGRTEDVTGSLTIEGGEVTEVEVEVDVTTLTSDSSRRDRSLRDQALETDLFPTASFVLVEPVTLPAEAESGDPFAIPAVGDLTIHGVTNRVTIDLEAQLVGDVIIVVGSTPIVFADYDVATPSALAVLSIEDNGIMEFQLTFARG